MFEQGGGLLLHRGEPARLDLDQQILPDQVDHETVDGDFDAIARSGVPPLQGGVEGFLPEGSDVGYRV
jgi:hypothetical protein